MTAFRILGIILAVLGVLVTIFPQWFGFLTGGPDPPADMYESIERRVRGGMILGFGLTFIAVTALRPWSISIASLVFYFMLGALISRMYGIVVDGSFPRQWMLVAVEAGFMALAAIWLWRSTSTTS